MNKEIVCSKCNALNTKRICSNCRNTSMSAASSGLVVVLDPNGSEVSKVLKFEMPGRYALKAPYEVVTSIQRGTLIPRTSRISVYLFLIVTSDSPEAALISFSVFGSGSILVAR
jgi:RNA polymerase subunit RPABC4/transcription elongation factor Spt4